MHKLLYSLLLLDVFLFSYYLSFRHDFKSHSNSIALLVYQLFFTFARPLWYNFFGDDMKNFDEVKRVLDNLGVLTPMKEAFAEHGIPINDENLYKAGFNWSWALRKDGCTMKESVKNFLWNSDSARSGRQTRQALRRRADSSSPATASA